MVHGDHARTLSQLAIFIGFSLLVVKTGGSVLTGEHFGQAASLRPRLRNRTVPILALLVAEVDVRLDILVAILIYFHSLVY